MVWRSRALSCSFACSTRKLISPEPHGALFVRYALELLVENRKAKDAIEALQAGRHPAHRINAPIYRSRRAAVRNGLRAFLAVLISAALFSLGGWPSASLGVVLVGVIIALSANTANPGGLAAAAVIAMPIAVLLAGVTEFLILDGVDQFPLLAIGMAPSVLAAALLCTTSNARLALIAFLVLVFFPVMLSPTNPQQYNPEPYLFSSFDSDRIGHPAVRPSPNRPPNVRCASSALVPEVCTSGDTRASGRWLLPAPG